MTASERLSQLLEKREFNDELYDAAINVVQELYLARRKTETLAKRRQQSLQKIHLLLKSKELLQTEKADFESHARHLLSPSKLKFVMENFANLHLSNRDWASKRQSEIDTTISDRADAERRNRFARISTIVDQLLELSSQEQPQIDDFFLDFWVPKVFESYQVHPDYEEKVRNNDLYTALIELSIAANSTEAKGIFNRQKDNVWRPRDKILSLEDTQALKAMCWISADTALGLVQGLNSKEREYAFDSFKMGPSVIRRPNEQYKICRWVLYVATSHTSVTIRDKVDKKWPELERAERINLYASAFAKLFDVVSHHDMFGFPYFQPFSDCNPSVEEFGKYVQFLEKSQSSNIAFVAETLCIH